MVPQASTCRNLEKPQAEGGRLWAKARPRLHLHGVQKACVEMVTTAEAGVSGGCRGTWTQLSITGLTLLPSPSYQQHQQLPAGLAIQSVKNTFLQPEKVQNLDVSVQVGKS